LKCIEVKSKRFINLVGDIYFYLLVISIMKRHLTDFLLQLNHYDLTKVAACSMLPNTSVSVSKVSPGEVGIEVL
jgi:hypothetical protein